MFKRIALISISLALNTVPFIGMASSALVFNNKETSPTVGVNFDWKYREGTVVIHPRHVRNVSNVNTHKYKHIIWKSRYASVVFHAGNKFKAGPALAGMNEKGLTATALFLKSSKYSPVAKNATLNTEEWVQYVLDKFQNVQEVIDDSANYQLVHSVYKGVPMNFHLILNDADGKAALLEYLEGSLIVRTQDDLNPSVFTNTDYQSSQALLNKYFKFGGTKKEVPGSYDSRARFIRAAHFLKRLPSFIANEEHIAYAFNGLSDVAQAPGTATPTQTSLVFDITSKTIYFRSINEATLRTIPFSNIKFDEITEPLAINAYQHFKGDVSQQFKSMNG